jgi:hypothetical protein
MRMVDGVDGLFERVVTPKLVKDIIRRSESMRLANRRWKRNNPEKVAAYAKNDRKKIINNPRYRSVVSNSRRYRHLLALANRRIFLLESKIKS